MRYPILVLILFLGLTTITKASSGSEHILGGQFKQGASNLSYWYDSSVKNYGYTSHFEHSVANWAVLSSKVNMTQKSSADADIKIYVGEGNLPIGYAGLTDMWVYHWYGKEQITADAVASGTNFEQARIRIDHYQAERSNYLNWGPKVKLAGHELGHALSLHHFQNSPSHSDKNSWMYSGATATLYPTLDDKNHLITKWGN